MERYSYFNAKCNGTLSAEDESKINDLIQFLDGKAYWCMHYKNNNYVSMCDLGHTHSFLDILDEICQLNQMPQVFAVDEKTCDRYAMHNNPPNWHYDDSEVKIHEFISFNQEMQLYLDNFHLALPNNAVDNRLVELLVIQADIRVEAIRRISEFLNL